MKIEIKHRVSLAVIFSHECENNTFAITVKAAVNAKAYLGGAYLRGAYLRGAYLGGADLGGADLRSADLGGAYLGGAYLGGADLRGAYLGGADLGGADLRGAYLGEFGKLAGDRPYFSVGPIGSRQDVLLSFQTEKGIFLSAGCFFGSVNEFKEKLQEEHGNNIHATEYAAALVLIAAHYAAFPANIGE